jgi:hypothetical protein
MSDPTEPTAPIEFVWTLITAAKSPLLEAELVHALRGTTAPKLKSPAERRLNDLRLLKMLVGGGDHPQRTTYDEVRGADDSAPTSHTLLARYGSWWEACSIAASMDEDGKLLRGRTFSGGARRGHARAKRYTPDELVGAVRLCAFTLGRRPSSTDYRRWREAAQRRALGRGLALRAPSTITLFKNSSRSSPWRTLLDRAAISDRELQKARGALLGTTREGEASPFLSLPFHEAARLAAELGGSLDWLAGRTTESSPTADPKLCFDPDAFRALRDRSGITPDNVRKAAGLTVGETRRLLAGTFEPTLGQLVDLASVLGVAAMDLCARRV